MDTLFLSVEARAPDDDDEDFDVDDFDVEDPIVIEYEGQRMIVLLVFLALRYGNVRLCPTLVWIQVLPESGIDRTVQRFRIIKFAC